MTETQTRSRTFDWADPLANGAELIGRSGIELFRMMISGELPPPPIMKLLDMERMEAVEGSVTVYMRAQEFHYNPLGGVHGGVIATLLDTAAACSVHSTLPPGVGYTSLDLTTKFLRPVTVASGLLRCTGSVLSKGRRTALAQAQLFDEQERLLAHATSSCMIFNLTEGA